MSIIESKNRSFHKNNVSVVSGDWTGTESYWTQVGVIYSTEVGSSDPTSVLVRYVTTNVGSTFVSANINFPDSNEWISGDVIMRSEYAVVTRREIHILEKKGATPSQFRIDAYNGTTLLSQYFIFRDLSDPKVFKYGLRINHVVSPTGFYLIYELSDDTPFNDFGIVVPRAESANITDPADVVGETYFFSIPTAYLPEGRALIGGAIDNGARLSALLAVILAVIAVFGVMYLWR